MCAASRSSAHRRMPSDALWEPKSRFLRRATVFCRSSGKARSLSKATKWHLFLTSDETDKTQPSEARGSVIFISREALGRTEAMAEVSIAADPFRNFKWSH